MSVRFRSLDIQSDLVTVGSVGKRDCKMIFSYVSWSDNGITSMNISAGKMSDYSTQLGCVRVCGHLLDCMSLVCVCVNCCITRELLHCHLC